jgi:diacylglycerol kinase family enzyme
MIARMLVEHRGRWEPQLEIGELGRAAFLIVANGDPYSYAGRIPMRATPNARFELGLDLVAPRRVRARDVPRLLKGAFRGPSGDDALITMHDADRIDVRCDRPLPLQADGEDLGDVDAAVFEAERDALAVLV